MWTTIDYYRIPDTAASELIFYSADEIGHHHLINKEGYRKLTRLEESAFNWLRTDCPQCDPFMKDLGTTRFIVGNCITVTGL